MISIRPSSVTDDAGTSPANVASDPEDHKSRIPLVWIPATLSVGLLIAAIYLGGRIVTGHPETKPPAPPAAAPIAIERLVTSPVKEADPSAQPLRIEATPTELPLVVREFVGPRFPADGLPMIAPQPGQRYIQVGALNVEAARRFVDYLRSQNLEPHVAPGPTPELVRVLIGPFDDGGALAERRAQLQSEGIPTYVRQY